MSEPQARARHRNRSQGGCTISAILTENRRFSHAGPATTEDTLSLRREARTVLQPGMTLHFMPAPWYADWGFETTESVPITETGIECLSDVPRRLLCIN
ncbi:MAG: hypothetical protein GKR94_18970 [Gammaproteobacteria bacterium]|nr:hypothetical protein [Gammaproteobacteria bacterium]